MNVQIAQLSTKIIREISVYEMGYILRDEDARTSHIGGDEIDCTGLFRPHFWHDE